MQQLLDGRGTRKQEKKGVKSSILSVPFCACEERGDEGKRYFNLGGGGGEGPPTPFVLLRLGKRRNLAGGGLHFSYFSSSEEEEKEGKEGKGGGGGIR